ncbi:hypothetical protein C4E04_16960 [Microvirga sp. 17 mud 1-3]|nr:hypothetical protein C4E04_16960 [Microvirga sp. 17 mud 1-3]
MAKGPLAPANPQTAASARETASRTLKNPGALQRTWTAAWGCAFDEVPGAVCPAWTKTEMGMVKSALAARWTQDAASLHGFLEWIVTDWSNIVGTHFAWMKRDPAPSLPSIRFVMTFKDRFFQAWNRRTVDKAIDGLSGEERRRRELMMRQGKTLEEANLLIAEERAQVRLRDEIEAGKKRAASMLQEARLTKDSTERMLRQPHARRNVVPLMPSPVTPAWELTEQEYTDTAALLGDLMKTMETNNQAQFQGA